MAKKTHRNKRKQPAFQNTPSQLTFTMQALKILKDSLANFEILLLANEHRTIPHLELAHLTFDELKQKLTDMLEREEWAEIILFDYNEIWILYTSIVMEVVEIQLKKEKEKDPAKLPVCLTLCNQFKGIIEANR